MNRSLTIAPGARRRGPPRENYGVTHGSFVWRISVLIQGLHRLLEIEASGERTHQAVHDLTVLEYRVEEMLRDAQVAAIRAALPEEKRACGL